MGVEGGRFNRPRKATKVDTLQTKDGLGLGRATIKRETRRQGVDAIHTRVGVHLKRNAVRQLTKRAAEAALDEID